MDAAAVLSGHSPSSPLRGIWKQPAETLRELIRNRPNYLVLPLAFAYGVTHCMWLAMLRGSRPAMLPTRWHVLALNVLLGGLLGILSLEITAPFYSWAARWFGGSTSRRDLRVICAWSCVPICCTLPLVLLIGVGGPEVLLVREGGKATDVVGPGWQLLVNLSIIGWAILGVWTIRTAVVGLAAVAGFGIGRAIASFLVGLLVFLVGYYGLGWLMLLSWRLLR
jgi:hypothetical protein